MPKSERSEVQEELSKLRKTIKQMSEEVPQLNEAFTDFLGTCVADGKLTCETKELIVLGAAVACHCPPCILLHTQKCLELGLSREEIIEAGYIGVLMGGGPAYTHMQYVFQGLEDAGA